jgi:GntR family transcriptional regulator, transcriptional repressor for pyruvate dehydrogenase complex
VTSPGAGTTAAGDVFRPVSVGRMSQVIVDQIKILLREGRLSPGDRLPSERELCQRFGVSRVTVREALRVLEAGGLVEIRVGARGGAFLTSPTTERLGEGLADLLTLSALTASEVTEARMVFEIGILPQAVHRANDEDVAALFAMVEDAQAALDDDTYSMAMSAAFHVRVATCTHNPAIEMLVRSFHGPLLMSLREARVAAPVMGHRGTDEHLQIARAIEHRDPDEAVRIMRRHLERTAQRVDSVDLGS